MLAEMIGNDNSLDDFLLKDTDYEGMEDIIGPENETNGTVPIVSITSAIGGAIAAASGSAPLILKRQGPSETAEHRSMRIAVQCAESSAP